MPGTKIPFHNRILFRLLVPVAIAGIACSTLLVYYLSSPMKDFLVRQFDANLRLASEMGIETCEEGFTYLLELRLEKNDEMNQTVQNEMIERIKAVSSQFPHVHLAVVGTGGIIGGSHPLVDMPDNWDGLQIRDRGGDMVDLYISGEKARSLVQYFPFWDWHIISFVFEKDYQRPIRMAYAVTYFSAFLVLIAVVGTLVMVFHLYIARPMKRLAAATDGVSEGKFYKVERTADNEFGRLMTSFNGMVDSLENEKKEVQRLIQELKESEGLFRSQFEFGNIGIAITKVKEGLIRANDRLCELLGYSEDELQGMVWSELCHPKDLKESMVNYRRMLKGDIENFETDMRLLHKNEHTILAHINISCFRNPDQSVRAVIISVIDMTKRKEAERALKKSEEYLRSLFLAAPTGIGVVVNRVFIQVNERLCGITGYSEEELIGKSARIVYPDDEEFEYVGKEKYGQINKRGTGTVETRWKRKDGKIIDVLLSSTPLDLDDLSKGVTFTALDITERKAMEVHLQQAQKMEAIGTLAGGIAHDFNNILAAIIGYTELSLSKVEPGTSIHDHLNKVIQAGKRAGGLVQQILTFGRRHESRLSPIRIKLIVKEIAKFIRATLPTTIEIKQKLNDDSTVIADPTQLHQIMMNLCTNAGHAMQEKGGVLEIGLDRFEPDAEFLGRHPGLKAASFVRLTVSDTGTGISADNLERIYDPYFTTKKQEKGTGLGLATVHGIVKSHGGIITVESQVGKGTTFEVLLPSAEDNDEVLEESEPKTMGGKERILLVDDEYDIIEIEKSILELSGYVVTATDNAEKALEIFSEKPDRFDLVITDLTMPKLPGDKLAQEIINIRKDIPIILCTGFSEGMTEEKAASMGVKRFLMKPVTVDNLTRTVRNILDDI